MHRAVNPFNKHDVELYRQEVEEAQQAHDRFLEEQEAAYDENAEMPDLMPVEPRDRYE